MTKICQHKGCKKETALNGNKRYPSRCRYCHSHRSKVTINGFLGNLYKSMRKRVEGRATKYPHLWAGKPIMPKDVFLNWAKNHPDFLSLYKRWTSCDFDRKLTPSVNRINSAKGYVLGNIEWLTNSQNSGLAGSVKSMKAKKAIYNLLGVNNNV